MVGNAHPSPVVEEGQCHRKYTALRSFAPRKRNEAKEGKGEKAR